ncbi:MAG: hypothetical protein ACLFU7_08920 [Armatimonadota bacterium]
MKSALPLVLMLLTAVALHAQEPPGPDLPLIGENLIENGSFERSPLGPVPPGDVPEGWWREAYGARDGQLAIVEDAAPGQGHKSVQVTNTEDNNKSGLHGPLVEIDPTQAYIQFGWMKIGDDSEGPGLSYGRQWLTADEEGADQQHSRSYNYTPRPEPIPGDWQYTEQLLLPDPNPDDGKFSAGQIPANARYLRIWALAYNWVGTGYFDGLGLYRVDYASMARREILGAIDEAEAPEIRAEIEAELKDLPQTSELRPRATELLGELARIEREALQDEQRHVNDWIADEERTPKLLDQMESLRWELKIEALLRTEA